MSSQNVPITVAHGDGIGPEIMAATLEILTGAGARIALLVAADRPRHDYMVQATANRRSGYRPTASTWTFAAFG